jgi:transposase
MDESRFGLFTRNGKALTAKGVKPICPFQQVFKTTYLFGAFSRVNGDKFLLELPFCNADTFQLYLNEFSAHNQNEYKIMVLDNGAFHEAEKLKIPENIFLMFLPPYSPELNPAEKIWAHYKRKFTNRLFNNRDQITQFIIDVTDTLCAQQIINTCKFDYIFSNLFWTI